MLNTLGARSLDKVYENALAYEVRAPSLSPVQQYELKIVKALDDAHMRSGAGPEGRMQCTNYLKATSRELCLLLNFDKPRMEIKRLAHGL
jgi:hypothetical protein